MKENKQKSIAFEQKNAWDGNSAEFEKKVMDFSEGYKKFLDTCKTEREAVVEIVRQAKEKGFKCLGEYIKNGQSIKKGDRIYKVFRKKAVMLYVIGEEDIEKGVRMVGSHLDSPRLDLKPNPLYEEEELAMFKTHYYGGIKKYQWISIPLSMHGTVMKKNGESIEISIGEDENDPVFFISDLLPHLAKDQYKKNLREAVTGESLNLIIGSMLSENKDISKRYKERTLEILKEKYNIDELDLMTAEIEIVPAGKARDVGLDRSMIVAYGQDDRSCAYASLMAIFDIDVPKYTSVALFLDKEEIGSTGSTGAESLFYDNTLAEIINLQVNGKYSDIILRRALQNSKVLSADVVAAYDPNFPSVLDKLNAGKLNRGICFSKYTGSGGKGGCSDADSEFFREVVDIFEENDVMWQVGELGKVDQGGGGTIAYMLASKGSEVIDCGVPIISMHGVYELSSKADMYYCLKAYYHFMKN